MLIMFGEEYLVIAPKGMTRKQVIDASNVIPSSWAAELMNRIFDCIFGNTADVVEEYEKFYKIEYATFNNFLEQVYGLDEEDIRLITQNLSDERVLEFGNLRSEGDYETSSLIEHSEEIQKGINKILSTES